MKIYFQTVITFLTIYCQSINIVLGHFSVPIIVFCQCWENQKGLLITVKLLAHYRQIYQRIDHKLLIAKVNAYGSILTALMIICQIKNSGLKQIHPLVVGMKVVTSVKSRPSIIQISF